MLMEWLEPAFDKKILESTISCDAKTKLLDDNINELLNRLKCELPESFKVIVFELESSIGIKTIDTIRNTYKLGFKDGLQLGYNIKQDLEVKGGGNLP